jgi:hypothetical protein
MENLSEVSGYVASTLVVFTFVAKDMRLLRTIAIFSNLAFIVLRYDRVAAARPFPAPGVTAAEHCSTCRGRQSNSIRRHGCPNFGRRHDMSRPIAPSAPANFPQHAEDSAPSLANRTKLVIGRPP